MQDCKLGDTPVANGDEFNLNQCPKNDLKTKEMQKILCALVVGSLMHAQVCTCSNIVYIDGVFDQSRMDHQIAPKQVLQYLQRTKKYMLINKKSDKLEIIGYSDSDFVGY